MSAWRGKAIEYLPDFRRVISAAGSPMALWIELRIAFEDAFHVNNTEVVEPILKYARWSWKTRNEDARQAVACAFLEHLPENEKMCEQIPRWFSRIEFEQLREVFKYHAGADAVDSIAKRYVKSRH